ncbi:DNA-binding transcriptional regulator, GntR family [Microbacterium saccharophilum]|uniref:DNA-binding transcriptional regulator, GntR family n=1 Tax=Microbacterium saccharophilum TaxID=1213358 RepID=A0A7Z7CYL9_9MICO|nr:DNA-binding transcriptional regulator, GntR family [Microbacterium saccharophilum]
MLTSRGKRIHDVVRADILGGKWMPGERLQPAVLATSYQTSTTVVREALTRLAGENFIDIQPNRGFFVPRLSLDVLRDLTEVRCRTESLAIELAVDRGDLAWEAELTAAHHTLARTPRRGAHDPQHVSETWAEVHRAFHMKLIDACDVPVLIDFSRRLADATELYRRWAAPSTAATTRSAEEEHAAILAATLSRDAQLASELLRQHYERTVQVVLESGLVEGIESAKV